MIDERFTRTALLLGQDGLERLQDATVMVVGLGAVGGYALEALARSGIGRLILVDFDTFEATNINRQILALSSTLGQKKTETAKKRVLDINPKCNVLLKDVFINNENISILLNEKIDFVVDAIDSIKEKCALMKTLTERKINFISAMGAALKTEVETIKIATLDKTFNCQMARAVRQNLKKQGVDLKKIVCAFSAEQCKSAPQSVVITPASEKNILGSLPTVTAVMGLSMAHYVILQLAKGQTDVSNA